jgi:hypothetical protein
MLRDNSGYLSTVNFYEYNNSMHCNDDKIVWDTEPGSLPPRKSWLNATYRRLSDVFGSLSKCVSFNVNRTSRKLFTHLPFISFFILLFMLYYHSGNDGSMIIHSHYSATDLVKFSRQAAEREFVMRPDEICRGISALGQVKDHGIWLLNVGLLWEPTISGLETGRVGLRVVTSRCNSGFAILRVRNRTGLMYYNSKNEKHTTALEGDRAFCVQRELAESSDKQYTGMCET